MSDLFDAPSLSHQNEYTAKDIEVLEGLEPVRKRPGMYIGGTDEKALHHLVSEIVDNAMDEAVAGHANRIEIRLEKNNFISIRDNGRGIPIDPHPKFPDLSALEVILTTLHSGGKFNTQVYQTSGGLHGVGISIVNALSDFLEVEVARNRQTWKQLYSRGKSQSPLTHQKEPTNWRGTRIRFHPDPEIFGTLIFNPSWIYQLAKAKAYLFKGIEIIWVCEETLIGNDSPPSSAKLHYPEGLRDYLRDKIENQPTIIEDAFAGEAVFPNNEGRIEWAIAWMFESSPSQNEYSPTFCNTIPTPQGGTHENGFRQALVKGLRHYAQTINHRKGGQILSEDIFGEAVFVMSCFMVNPQFQGQTKEKLVSLTAQRLVENAIKDHFDLWLGSHPQAASVLLDYIINRSELRLQKRQTKEVARASATRRLRLPGKLADCSSGDPSISELFLVEGDSAGGSAKQARNRQVQAILPLRGKILNVANATPEKLKLNQEISDLILALGCGSGTSCDISKLRYHKVIIMTDADVDGAHIASLLLTFFFREMRPLVESGHIFLAQPPLYRLTSHGKTVYAKDEIEKNHLLKTFFKKTSKVEIGRFKGLGEMLPIQLRETTMDIKKRILQRVVIIDNETIKNFIERLMGKTPESRYAFIHKNANLVESVDL